MKSYLEILTELKTQVEADPIPDNEKMLILSNIERLFVLLWPYSD